jgi:hypothetical protein
MTEIRSFACEDAEAHEKRVRRGSLPGRHERPVIGGDRSRFYIGRGQRRQSITALIPAFLGVPFAALGLLGRDTRRLKLAMHAATAVAVLGFLGSARGLPGLLKMIGGQSVDRPAAAVVQAVTALICLLFLVLAFKSFADARRTRSS